MSMQMERRIRKAEEVVAARKPIGRKVKIMGCADDGDMAEVARFNAEVEEAVRDGFFVIRLMSLQPKATA